MERPTRVFVIADMVTDARRLGDLFSRSPGFVLTGVAALAHVPAVKSSETDVFVIASTLSVPLPVDARVLWIGKWAPTDSDSHRADTWLGPEPSPAKIRAAVQALAAGLRVESAPAQNSIHHDEFVLLEPLTEREVEILNLVAEGLSNPQIAKRLKLSRNTVKFHVSSIIGKLGANSRTEAVTLGLRRGLVII